MGSRVARSTGRTSEVAIVSTRLRRTRFVQNLYLAP